MIYISLFVAMFGIVFMLRWGLRLFDEIERLDKENAELRAKCGEKP